MSNNPAGPPDGDVRPFRCARCGLLLGSYNNATLQIDLAQFHRTVNVTCCRCGTRNRWSPRVKNDGGPG